MIRVTKNLVNCTGNIPDYYETGETVDITLKANTGARFENATDAQFIYNEDGFDTPVNMAISDDKTTAHIVHEIPRYTEYITIYGKATAHQSTGITVLNNIANTTETHSYTNGKATITITSEYNDGFRLRNVKATYTETGETKSVDFETSLIDGHSVATATFDVPDGTQITVTGEVHKIVRITKNLVNCTGNMPDYYETGETVDITLKANTGTKFVKDTDAQFIYNEEGIDTPVNMKISSDRQTATIHYTIPTDVTDITIYGNCSVVAPVGDDSGSINVYIVTIENLKAFANVRFVSTKDNTIVYHDLGKYVNRIKRIYTNVEKGATDVIRCANYNTNISVFQPVKSKITLDFGNVVVPSHNNDNTDFESTVKLFIPFVGFVDVPNDYTGETLNLQIDINVVTGNGLYRLIYNGTLIQTGDCTPSQDVLYKTADMELTKIGGEEWNEQRYMGLEPYLFVKWYESKNPNGRNNDFKKGNISSFTGFNSFDNVVIQPTADMLAREQEMILTTLLKGVYVE